MYISIFWLPIVSIIIGFIVFVITSGFYRSRIRQNYIYVGSLVSEDEEHIDEANLEERKQGIHKEIQRAFEVALKRDKLVRERASLTPKRKRG